MTEQKASRFPVPPVNSLPEDIRSRLLAVQEKSGFIPNVFLTLAFRPDEFRAFFAYHDALMEKDGGLTKAEREMIVVATSSANQCQYCVIAHGAILRIRAKNPLLADQVAVNYRKADITPRQLAVLDFAMKVSQEAQRVSDADFAALGIPDKDTYTTAYCKRTHRDKAPNMDYYAAYNFFRLAGILQGIVGRVRDGTANSAHAAQNASGVRPLAERGWEYAKRAGAPG